MTRLAPRRHKSRRGERQNTAVTPHLPVLEVLMHRHLDKYWRRMIGIKTEPCTRDENRRGGRLLQVTVTHRLRW